MVAGRLAPPQWYDPERRIIWDDTIAQITATQGELAARRPDIAKWIDVYVCSYANFTQASRLVAQTSVLISRDKGGPAENPALGTQRRCAADLARASRELGLNRNPKLSALASSPLRSDGRTWCPEHQRDECKHDRKDGSRCHSPRVIAGTGSCRMHAGMSAAKAKAKSAEYKARLYSSPADVTPGEALLDEVQWAAGHVRELRAQVSELAEQPGPDGEPGSGLWWGVAEELRRDGEVVEQKLKAGPHAKLAEYGRERDRLVKVAAAAHAAGAHDQAVNVAAALGAGARRLFDAIFAALDLTEDQQARVPIVVPEILAQFDTGTEGEAAGQG